jgi:hypothetical protein
MPVPANATDRAKGVARARISRSQPPIGGRAGSAAGLSGAGPKREDKRPTDSGPTYPGQRRARRYCPRRCCQRMDCRHHAPISIAPSSMVVADRRAGSFAPPSEAACVFHLLHDAHKQVFSLSSRLWWRRSPTQLDTALPPPFFDEFEVNPFVMTFETEGKKNVARSFRLAIGKTAPTLDFCQDARGAGLRMTPTRH